MISATILIVLIIIAAGLFINFSEYDSIKTQEVKEQKTDEQKMMEEKLRIEEQNFKARWLADLSQVRQTNLKLTVDEDPNLRMILHGDYSDDAALVNKGISLSDKYNSESYNYSFKKTSKNEYLEILTQLESKYAAYLKEINNYKWTQDISAYEKFLNEEHEQIKKEIKALQILV